MAELDEDALGLIAVEIDLGDVGNALQPFAERLSHVLELRVGGAVAGNRIKHRIDVAEIVVDQGPDHACGKIGENVGHLLAQLQEQERHFARRASSRETRR